MHMHGPCLIKSNAVVTLEEIYALQFAYGIEYRD